MAQKSSIRGKTVRWTFADGPMKDKLFEHTFGDDGSVTWRMPENEKPGQPGHARKSEIASLSEDVAAVSYLSESGYTLTVVLDFRSHRLVAFASNEKELTQQSGKFEIVDEPSGAVRERKTGAAAHH